MLPTLVIGLREGLEAALIVGIVAAFLKQRGRADLLRWVFVGIGSAVILCLAAGVALDILSRELPQKQQEGLETVVGACAVAMVTYMVVWMRRHSRDLKGQLEGAAGSALAVGSGFALVLMAFLAVLREGLETAVFLLAAFNEANNGTTAMTGALIGIAVAIAVGWGIYRGGIRLNLSKFFRATGVVLVLVAAGLVVSALRTAHEAGWLNFGQQATVDLSQVVQPGTVVSSLLTGVLGMQAHPVLIELVGWLVYLVPLGVYVAWPPGKGLARGTLARLSLIGAGVTAVAAVVLAVVNPTAPQERPTTPTAGGGHARVISTSGNTAVVETTTGRAAGSSASDDPGRLSMTQIGSARHSGIHTDVYAATRHGQADGPSRLTYSELASRNGGRLPLGVRASDSTATVRVGHPTTTKVTVWVVPGTERVVDVRWREAVGLTAELTSGSAPVGQPSTTSTSFRPSDVSAAVAQARADEAAASDHSLVSALVWVLTSLTGVLVVTALLCALGAARLRRSSLSAPTPPSPELAKR
ncbi:MAG: iron uptake transporter permease EfeU [Nocardioidaceae bacterium]